MLAAVDAEHTMLYNRNATSIAMTLTLRDCSACRRTPRANVGRCQTVRAAIGCIEKNIIVRDILMVIGNGLVLSGYTIMVVTMCGRTSTLSVRGGLLRRMICLIREEAP